MSAVYGCAVRFVLPHAIVFADRFYLIKESHRHGRCDAMRWRVAWT